MRVSRLIREAPCQTLTETQMSAWFFSSSHFVPVIAEHGGSSEVGRGQLTPPPLSMNS